MKCPNCGTELNDGLAFCSNCGYKMVNNESVSNENQGNNNSNQQSNQQLDKLKKKKSYWWIPVVLFFSFPITTILKITYNIISGSSNTGIIYGILTFLNRLGFLACGLTIPSIVLVIVLNNRNK